MTDHRDGGTPTAVDKLPGTGSAEPWSDDRDPDRIPGPRSVRYLVTVSAPLFQADTNGLSKAALPTSEESTVSVPPPVSAPGRHAGPDIDWP